VIWYTSLVYVLIYCKYKSISADLITLQVQLKVMKYCYLCFVKYIPHRKWRGLQVVLYVSLCVISPRWQKMAKFDLCFI